MRQKLSIIIPLLNEEKSIKLLYSRLNKVLQTLQEFNHEIIFVDDGSSDSTLHELQQIAFVAPNVAIISFTRNFGHQAALTAGLDFATGDLVVFMDGDLQDPPEILLDLIEKNNCGYDIVYVYRASREGDPLLKAGYFVFYRILNFLANVKIPNDSGDYCLLSKAAADALRMMPERHRFLRGMRAWAGFNQIGIPLHRPSREFGKSKYSIRKLLLLALDGLFSFSTAPLRIATLFGIASILASVAIVIYWLIQRVLYQNIPTGFAAGMAVSVFLAGMQFLLLGIIGEYVGRIYEEAKQRPIYLIRKITTSNSKHTS